MKLLNRILFFFSLFLLYIIGREFVELYILLRSLHPFAGYAGFIIIIAFMGYFAIIPLYKIFKIPKHSGPISDKSREDELIKKRLDNFPGNKYLQSTEFDFASLSPGRAGYDKVIAILENECRQIRKRYVSQLFYRTTIVQNGFLDAVLILSSNINLVKEIFILYNGRVSNRDLFNIAKKVYYAIAIGGSQGVEYATEEIISKFGFDSLKGIPFADKVIGSMAEGFVNAVLLTRISYITENYCKLTYIQSDRDLNPSTKFITSAVDHITSDMSKRIINALKKLAIDKAGDFARYAANPVKYLFSQSEHKSEFSEEASKTIRKHTATAMATAMVPIPAADIAAITIVEINMIRELTRIYGHNWNDKLARQIIGIAAAAMVGGGLWASVLKFIPSLGTVSGSVIQMGIAGTVCYALGRAYQSHLESGEESFDKKEFEETMKQHLAEGKRIADELKEDVKKGMFKAHI